MPALFADERMYLSTAQLIGYPPDRSVGILRYEECAVVGDRNANRPSPHFGVVGNKPGKKVLVLAGRNSIPKPNPDYLVSGALRSVPRSVFGGEAVAAIFRRKHPAIVEHQAQGSRMGLDEDVGSGDLSLQIGAFTGMPRVLVVPDIKPRPAIERALPHPRDVVRDQVVAQTVALVCRAIDIAAGRMNGKTHAVADPRTERSNPVTVRI